MNIVILDFEATCCENNEFPRHEMEIIEFGAICINSETGETYDNKFSAFIKPVLNPVLTVFCKNLTSINQVYVDCGEPFKVTAESFIDWYHNHNADKIYSWGDFDKNIFVRDCKRNGIDSNDFVKKHVNAKQLFGDKMNIRPCSVNKALRISNMKFEGIAHRALYDAINIGRLVKSNKLW